MNSDPLSDILSLTKVIPTVAGGFTAGGSWAIRFPAPCKLKFFALLKGKCWLILESGEAPIYVQEGDILLLSLTTPFTLAATLDAQPIDARTLFAGKKTQTIGHTEDCVQIGGHVLLDAATGYLLSSVLPTLIHIRASQPQAESLKWLLTQYVKESARPEAAGQQIATSHLVNLMFVQILRIFIEDGAPMSAGWLRGIGDRRLAPALRRIHGAPEYAWTVEELAKTCAMSRTSFAIYFRDVVGSTPLNYLTRWRMQLAEKALRDDDVPLNVLAERLGYASENAFSTAFRRVTGKTPRSLREPTLPGVAQ
ncbi:AraC family transcriptional regulator [Enterobacter sp. Ap-1006]|uniref:AraC family transcriptional regulator n=1 Tax=Enterobacter sp. Ap-1006 TaxID=2608345 RepID=UPI0019664168